VIGRRRFRVCVRGVVQHENQHGALPVALRLNHGADAYIERTEHAGDLREDAERSDAILARIPAARWAEPSDIAGAVLFLCSRAADYVHGAVLPVDGGWLAR